MSDVSGIVKAIQDIMRKDAGTYGDAQRLEQLGWMFFLKIFDDNEAEQELLKDKYKSPLPKHLRWSTWATDEEGITGDALLDFVNNTLLPKLKALTGGGDKVAGLIRTAFEDANNYMKNGTLMRQVINKINGIDFNASDDRHTFGDIYEKLLKDLQSAGNAGELRHPARRHPVHRRTGRSPPRREDPRLRMRHGRLPRLRHRTPAQTSEDRGPRARHSGLLRRH